MSPFHLTFQSVYLSFCIFSTYISLCLCFFISVSMPICHSVSLPISHSISIPISPSDSGTYISFWLCTYISFWLCNYISFWLCTYISFWLCTNISFCLCTYISLCLCIFIFVSVRRYISFCLYISRSWWRSLLFSVSVHSLSLPISFLLRVSYLHSSLFLFFSVIQSMYPLYVSISLSDYAS